MPGLDTPDASAGNQASRAPRRLSLVAAFVLTATLSLTGCAAYGDPTSEAHRKAETTGTTIRNASREAVLALSGRIVDAVVKPVWSGLAEGLVIEFEVSTADPITVDELRDVVRAARDAWPYDPVDFSVVAYVIEDGDDIGTVVDTWTAGAELFGVDAAPKGIMMMRDDVTRVLGPWPGR